MASLRPVGRSAATLDVGRFAATLDKDRVSLCRFTFARVLHSLLHPYTFTLLPSRPLRPNPFKCNTYKPSHKC